MSEASDLIERMERETGQRWDANDGDNAAMAGLIGAIARKMGKSNHDERDDVAAGLYMQHKKEDDSASLMALLLATFLDDAGRR